MAPLAVNGQVLHLLQSIHEEEQQTNLFVKRGASYVEAELDARSEAVTTTVAPIKTASPAPKPPVHDSSSSGFFDPGPAGPPPPQSTQPCLSPGSTVTYVDANGTTHNYTNLGGNCLGLDVGETGSPGISNVTISGGNGLHDPFFASVTPQTFALAGATIACAILLLLLFLSRNRKPWVQKLATLSMTVSLVTYMVVTVNMLEDQYAQGRYDADALRGVNQNMVCKIFAYVADLAILLAQVQTLVRIFPRKRDKVIIKWTGLCLIALTMIFCALFQFLRPSAPPPSQRSTSWQIFLQILSPLNYLFSIALATIYALCVFYFGIIHRRTAFTIPAGLILALLSVACVTMPIVFFCLDIWAEFVVGWGQYIRAIASVGSTVIVLEWIERVDEEETKRDGKSGVLGRRIFEDEFDSTQKQSSPDEFRSRWNLGKKIRVPSMFSGLSDKASEWSMKLQSKLDRRTSTPTPPAVTKVALSDLNSAVTSHGGTVLSTPSATEDTRTTTTSDDYATTYTGTSAASSFSPLAGGKRPKKKHHYPIARSANRTRQLTQTPPTSTSTSPLSEIPQTSTSAPLHFTPESDEVVPSNSNAPSFHSRESDDGRAPFSVLPGFTTDDYFLDHADLEKRGWMNNRIR